MRSTLVTHADATKAARDCALLVDWVVKRKQGQVSARPHGHAVLTVLSSLLPAGVCARVHIGWRDQALSIQTGVRVAEPRLRQLVAAACGSSAAEGQQHKVCTSKWPCLPQHAVRNKWPVSPLFLLLVFVGAQQCMVWFSRMYAWCEQSCCCVGVLLWCVLRCVWLVFLALCWVMIS
jgi:hypothetical protein